MTLVNYINIVIILLKISLSFSLIAKYALVEVNATAHYDFHRPGGLDGAGRSIVGCSRV